MSDFMINIQDVGAVPGQDCSAVFQQAVDSLTGPFGGTILVPAADKPYYFTRPVLVDRPQVRIVGEHPNASMLLSTGYAPPLIFGVSRQFFDQPLSADYWVDLNGLLDNTAVTGPNQRFGYRSHSAGQGFGAVSLPCSPFGYSPPDNTFWSGATALTVDFVIRNNAMPWAGQSLFGLVDANNRPAPFWARIDATSGKPLLRFVFRTADGLLREIRVPFDATDPILRCSVQLDFISGAVGAWVNNQAATVDPRFRNNNWPGGQPVALSQNWYSTFHLGIIANVDAGLVGDTSIDERLGVPGDLTFGALRLSASTVYTSDANGKQLTLDGKPVTDAVFLGPAGSGFSCWLPMNESQHRNAADVPDTLIPWQAQYPQGQGVAQASGFGMFLRNTVDMTKTIDGNTVERLAVSTQDGGYGQDIGLGLVYNFTLDNAVLTGGGQGIGSYHLGVSYPIVARLSHFAQHHDTAIYSYGQMLHCEHLVFNGYHRSAVKGLLSMIDGRDLFFAGTSDTTSVVRLFQSSGTLEGCNFDMEGDFPSDSYIWASLAYDTGGPTQLVVRDCQGSSAGPNTATIRLDSADRTNGLAQSNGSAGWVSVERSFNHHADPRTQAVVAVDGPLWQGLYQGLPPAGIPLALNTVTPNGSARIGVSGVPAPVVPPSPVAPGADPILALLPGLLGYYRADALTEGDGQPITQLTDLSPAGNHGVPVGAGATRQLNALNGHAAIRFATNGAGFRFPSMRGTSGALTMFFVSVLPPGVFTAGGAVGELFCYGNEWGLRPDQLADVAVAFSAFSDVDPVVYAVRCTAGAERLLSCWTNGRPSDSTRRDDLGPVLLSAPTIVGNTYGPGVNPTAVAVVVDGALSADQIGLVSQYLLNQFGLAV